MVALVDAHNLYLSIDLNALELVVLTAIAIFMTWLSWKVIIINRLNLTLYSKKMNYVIATLSFVSLIFSVALVDQARLDRSYALIFYSLLIFSFVFGGVALAYEARAEYKKKQSGGLLFLYMISLFGFFLGVGLSVWGVITDLPSFFIS